MLKRISNPFKFKAYFKNRYEAVKKAKCILVPKMVNIHFVTVVGLLLVILLLNGHKQQNVNNQNKSDTLFYNRTRKIRKTHISIIRLTLE